MTAAEIRAQLAATQEYARRREADLASRDDPASGVFEGIDWAAAHLNALTDVDLVNAYETFIREHVAESWLIHESLAFHTPEGGPS